LNILGHLRVVECAAEIAGPYCTKLYADLGADVIKVEPPEGDPFRRRSGAAGGDAGGDAGDAPLFKFLNAGKRSVVAHREDGVVRELLTGADLLVESLGPGVLDHDDIRRDHPALVIVTLSAYGYTGPYRGRPATEFTVQAESGSMTTRGRPDQRPFQAGGRIFEWLLGTYAAVGSLAAVRQARATGEGDVLDCSLMEACDLGGSVYADLTHQLAGRPPLGLPGRSVEIPSIEPTADGWVGFNTNTRQQFESFLSMIGRRDLLDEDPSWALVRARHERADQWNAIVRAWTTERSTEEIVELASLFRIPVAPVNNGKTVLDHPHFVARGIWGDAPDGTFKYPLPPYRIDGERPRPRGPAPKLGEHPETGKPRTPAPVVQPRSPATLPLEGIRILDATAWWAGPAATHVLAALGAEVIHIEAIQHPDGMRSIGGAFIDLPSWWERSSIYLGVNTNKQDLTLDLGSPVAREIFWRLLAQSDVLVENFSPRVFDQFGLTWEAVNNLNPRAIMVRMPAFGLDGPWRDNVGFAQTMEQMTGLAWVTGHQNDQPRIPRGPCDPLAGMSAAFAALVGLERREATGLGSFIEASMIEPALNAAAEQVVEYTAHGAVLSRDGNRSRDAAPQGLYPCRGSEQWLALSVADDGQWQALTDLLGNLAWTSNPALATASGRHEAHDLIDDYLEQWSRTQNLDDAVEALVRRGIPAAPLRDPRIISTHPQMVARSHFETLEHPVLGPLALPTFPFKSASIKQWHRSPAPLLGEHNTDILTRLLSLDAATIAGLAADNVVGMRPLGVE
jgi:crotonobetainyl-CoA:carnitine CoA-transferase CaiB-like acyl-CoA transferase